MTKSIVRVLTGNLIGHRDGFGFLRPESGGDDIFVPNREMLKAMHGDKVLVKILKNDRKGRPEAHITEVLHRAQLTLVGRLIYERGIYVVVPEDNRIKHDVVISSNNMSGAQPGQVVTVEIIDPPTRDTPPIGKITEVIGKVDDPGMEIEIAVRKFGIPSKFSDEVVNYSKKLSTKISPEEIKNRVDLRDVDFITIDGADAKDFDDAIYTEEIKNCGWRLLVAIADVSSYVESGDLIDKEALKRSTSVYFPRKVIPMLPENLSNNICSLKPGEDRLTLVCDMVISKSGRVKAYQFYEAIICSSLRLTYTDAWEIISNNDQIKKKEFKKISSTLFCFYDLLQKFLQYRNARGSIDFETVETDVKINCQGKIEKILPKVRNNAHRIIEECMIAANTCAADFLSKKKSKCLYRIHEKPKTEKIHSLRDFLKMQGLKLSGNEQPSAKDFSELLKLAKKRSDFEILQTLILRTMQQARYSPENEGHFALSIESYSHFTSPIRRYPDLLLHRAIKASLNSKKYVPILEDGEKDFHDSNIDKWHAVGEHSSIAERRAEDASRDVLAWLKCHFMRNKEGEQFNGTVTGVAPFGLFVTLDTLYVEGLIHVSELGVEYFQHNEISHELRGERTGRKFKLYDKVEVQILRVDIDGRRIEFSFAPKFFRRTGFKNNFNDTLYKENFSNKGLVKVQGVFQKSEDILKTEFLESGNKLGNSYGQFFQPKSNLKKIQKNKLASSKSRKRVVKK